MNYIKQKYGNPPVIITENGMDDPNDKTISIKQALKDDKRIKYHNDYLTNLLAAIKIELVMLTSWIKKHKKVVELAKRLEVAKDLVVAAKDQVTTLKEKIESLESELANLREVASGAKARESSLKKSLPIAQKKTFDVEESSRLELDEQTLLVAYLRDHVKALKEQVSKFVKCRDQCFGEEALQKIDFTLNGGELVVEEAARVERYNPKHPDFPPSTVVVLVVESEDKDEFTIVGLSSTLGFFPSGELPGLPPLLALFPPLVPPFFPFPYTSVLGNGESSGLFLPPFKPLA
ncbi:hypothetical protein G4B88_019146 [Cannabis sativa]|uniref:Uncharacterized protein n=1 Tax=Cannabis sativa TaxID=3483 RepID=A0A7J6HM53_CANSA|nr:hypothetical protein G4B88_019146 [Cannabis sativa]